jgi:CBS domain containing-hemolysin-like protein
MIDTGPVLGIAIAAIFIILNGFFVAAEFALVKVRATQLHARVRRGDRKAIVAHQVISRLDRYLGVTQFGVTLASLGLGWVGEPAVSHLFERFAGRIMGAPIEGYAHAAVLGVAFVVLTFTHVLLGELVPKLIAIQRSEDTALFVATPVRLIYVAFRPLLFVLELATGFILTAMGLSADVASEGTLSESEILGILAANTASSPRGKEQNALVERVIRFAQRTARHAMVPRVDVASLPIGTTGADAFAFVKKQQFSRVIVTKARSLDEVAGYFYAKDFWLDPEAQRAPDLVKLRRDVLFVPETQGAVDVLRHMQREQTPIAVVVDEYGGTSGIVTMEDLLEEIVGEIRDELDEEPAKVVKVANERAWDVDGRATMEELRTLGVAVEESESAEPVGAIILARLGRLARVHDIVSFGDATAEVTLISRRRVTRVRVRPVESKAAVES